MFGTYRTFLALIVVVHHLISIPIIGHYAVHGFFILSGYLMTFVMNVSYGYSLRGIRAFSINRFLRLYPSYWVVLLLTLLSIAFFGESNAIKYREFVFFLIQYKAFCKMSRCYTLTYFQRMCHRDYRHRHGL